MSTVRMCDFVNGNNKVCGAVFSERAKGWATGQIAVMNNDGKMEITQVDMCPDHAPGAQSTRPEYPQLTGSVTPPDPRDWTDPRNPDAIPDEQPKRQYEPTVPANSKPYPV